MDTTADQIDLIAEFVGGANGLTATWVGQGELSIRQSVDGKSIKVMAKSIEDVLSRLDNQGHTFLQVNFVTGSKILITEKLVGFKPKGHTTLDMDKLPKVVTTPDLVSVIEALTESLDAELANNEDLDLLRNVFHAVLDGGEAVGFDMEKEKNWIRQIVTTARGASA